MEEIQSTISHLVDKISAISSNLACLERCAESNIIDGQALVGRLHPVTVLHIIAQANMALDAANHEIEILRNQLKTF